MTLYSDDEYINKDFKRCPVSKEWIKKEDCDSVAQGNGCKNKKDCRVYKLFEVKDEKICIKKEDIVIQ